MKVAALVRLLALGVLLAAGASAEPVRNPSDCLSASLASAQGISLYPAAHQIRSTQPAVPLQGSTKVCFCVDFPGVPRALHR